MALVNRIKEAIAVKEGGRSINGFHLPQSRVSLDVEESAHCRQDIGSLDVTKFEMRIVIGAATAVPTDLLHSTKKSESDLKAEIRARLEAMVSRELYREILADLHRIMDDVQACDRLGAQNRIGQLIKDLS